MAVPTLSIEALYPMASVRWRPLKRSPMRVAFSDPSEAAPTPWKNLRKKKNVEVPGQRTGRSGQGEEEQGRHQDLLPAKPIGQDSEHRRKNDPRDGEDGDEESHRLGGTSSSRATVGKYRGDGGDPQDRQEGDPEDDVQVGVQKERAGRGGSRLGHGPVLFQVGRGASKSSLRVHQMVVPEKDFPEGDFLCGEDEDRRGKALGAFPEFGVVFLESPLLPDGRFP